MASLQDALERTDRFLSQDLLAALRQVELRPVDFAAHASNAALEEMATAAVEIAYVHDSADALYRIGAFGQRLTMQAQLNAYRFVVIYRVPAAHGVDLAGLEPRFARWQKGAAHVGWQVGWRDTIDPIATGAPRIEVYAYAMLPEDFLWNELHQLYWRTDIVQMTRAFMLEARRYEVGLEDAEGLRPAAPSGRARQDADR